MDAGTGQTLTFSLWLCWVRAMKAACGMEVSPPHAGGRDYGKKAARRDAERARKAARSGLVRELAAEVEGAPEEVRGSM